MSSRKWTWILSLVVAIGLAAGGVSAASASPTRESLPQIKLPNAAKFVMSGSISSSGQTIPVSGSGAFSSQNAMLDVTLTAPQGTTSGPDKITFGAIVANGKLYVKAAGIDPSTDNKWYLIDTATLTQGMPGAVMGIPGSLTDVQAMLDAAISSKEVGKEAIGGAPTTKYQVDIDLQKVAAATGGSTAGTENSKLTMFLWVGDKDMYVHQLNLILNIPGPMVKDLMLQTAVNLNITLSDFDVPVTIAAPANAETLDLNAALGGDILGSMGGPITSVPVETAGMPRTGLGGDNTLLLTLLALSVGLVLSGVAVKRRAYALQRV